MATVARSAGTNSAALAAAATRERSSRTLLAPPPLGCTRLVNTIRYDRLAGFIQTEVPVKPRWPTESAGKNGEVVTEKLLEMSRPRARLPLPSTHPFHIRPA